VQVRGFLVRWRGRTSRRLLCDEAVTDARRRHVARLSARAFDCWKSYRERRRLARRYRQLCRCHYGVRLLRRVLSRWIARTAFRVKVRV
jgi:hypothetical protein